MTKKVLLTLPDDVHDSLKEYQIDCNHVTRTRSNLNAVLVELVRSGMARVPLSDTATAILKRAAAKKAEQSS
jgi:hypothetical protein